MKTSLALLKGVGWSTVCLFWTRVRASCELMRIIFEANCGRIMSFNAKFAKCEHVRTRARVPPAKMLPCGTESVWYPRVISHDGIGVLYVISTCNKPYLSMEYHYYLRCLLFFGEKARRIILFFYLRHCLFMLSNVANSNYNHIQKYFY